MSEKKLPKMGDVIPIDKFQVSKSNVRAKEPFGNSEKDRQLIANLKAGKIVGPFKARPEGNKYGVYVGRRRFLAKKEGGATSFIVGADCLIEEASDGEARQASLVENLDVLREDMDPVLRAKQLRELIKTSSLRDLAKSLGMSPSTLSEWLKPLDLSPKMQDAISERKILYSDALDVSRLNIPIETQDNLATVLEEQGVDAFKAELERVSEGKLKRGIPKGKYIVLRTTFDKGYDADLKLYNELEKRAGAKHQEIDDYCKWVLAEHIKTSKE